ncbi:hypothetical protein J4Q44_G00028570 [Coregonus suidteri]|uniref:CUB and sushi domain-containing protein 1-like n=1 Tax=Coregonus suidteri TaxID=861788 RepID=A0AAN8MKC6_9TELE
MNEGGIKQVSNYCPDPGEPENGKRSGTDFSIGATAQFTCDEDHVLQGSKTITCQGVAEVFAAWSDHRPVCKVKTCGSTLHGPSGTFTSPNFPIQYESNSHCVWIITAASCGGDVRGPGGIILSPGYPEFYPNSLNCTWTVEVGHGKGVQFMFHSFHLEDHHDYLLITENGSFALPLARLTGSERPAPVNAGLYGNFKAQLRFISDFSICFQGFNISFSEYNLEPCEDPGTPRFGWHTGISFGIGDSLVFSCNTGYRLQGAVEIWCLGGGRRMWSAPLPRCVAECGSTVSNSEGVLLSPNYPLNYDNSHECVYSIQVETGKGINVSASTFQLAQGDILKVYDGGDSAAPVLGTYTGSTMLGLVLTSTSNHLWLEFYSDQEHTAGGFRLSYSSEEHTPSSSSDCVFKQ